MRHIGIGQRRQDPGLAQDHAVAAGTQMARPTAQHVGAAGSGEAQHHVLGAAGDGGDILQRAFAEPLGRHPPSHRVQVDRRHDVARGVCAQIIPSRWADTGV
ncbi:hypothetical protein IWGMT90018_60990 [Mycobacterium kiyosense]|nr:hypothetical protein IWGMT90018_60990 [Mycobacterium kiyosense]